MQIVLATNNKGKIREFSQSLAGRQCSIVAQAELGIKDVPETGLTFVENALIKARHACRASGLPAIADDSGLVVEALAGAPGIISARYAGTNASAEQNIQKLLAELAKTKDPNRTAFFHCALVYMRHAEDPMPLICQASWLGYILDAPVGTDGFGYDPIFYVPTEKKSASQLDLAEKNRLSHRGQALRMLLQQLPEKLC